jgi:hypothetical protein
MVMGNNKEVQPCPHQINKQYCYHWVANHGIAGRCGIGGHEVVEIKECILPKLQEKLRKKKRRR